MGHNIIKYADKSIAEFFAQYNSAEILGAEVEASVDRIPPSIYIFLEKQFSQSVRDLKIK